MRVMRRTTWRKPYCNLIETVENQRGKRDFTNPTVQLFNFSNLGNEWRSSSSSLSSSLSSHWDYWKSTRNAWFYKPYNQFNFFNLSNPGKEWRSSSSSSSSLSSSSSSPLTLLSSHWDLWKSTRNAWFYKPYNQFNFSISATLAKKGAHHHHHHRHHHWHHYHLIETVGNRREKRDFTNPTVSSVVQFQQPWQRMAFMLFDIPAVWDFAFHVRLHDMELIAIKINDERACLHLHTCVYIYIYTYIYIYIHHV